MTFKSQRNSSTGFTNGAKDRVCQPRASYNQHQRQLPLDAKTPEKKVTPKNLRTEALSTAELIDWFHVKAKPPFAKK